MYVAGLCPVHAARDDTHVHTDISASTCFAFLLTLAFLPVSRVRVLALLAGPAVPALRCAAPSVCSLCLCCAYVPPSVCSVARVSRRSGCMLHESRSLFRRPCRNCCALQPTVGDFLQCVCMCMYSVRACTWTKVLLPKTSLLSVLLGNEWPKRMAGLDQSTDRAVQQRLGSAASPQHWQHQDPPYQVHLPWCRSGASLIIETFH